MFRFDATAAAILMFPPPPTRTVGNPTAEERAMFVLFEVVMILGLGAKFLGIVVLTVEVKLDVVRIGVLMRVWEVPGRKSLIGVPLGREMSRCCVTSPGGLTVMVEVAGRKILIGDGVPTALTEMLGELS